MNEIDRLGEIVQKIARKYTRSTLISWEDAAQAGYEKIFRAKEEGKFQGGVEAFYHWAATVARFAIIDYVRKEKPSHCQSLDQKIPGTEVSQLEAIADEFNALDVLEHRDLVIRAIAAIIELDRENCDRGYLKLWVALKQGKTQSQIAAELGTNQATVSKRWKELSLRVAQRLGLLETKNIQQTNLRKRSESNQVQLLQKKVMGE
jgi:RNA polymerase sigma factor (sigma-70 family)